MNNQKTIIVFGSNIASLSIVKYIKKYVARVIVLGHDEEQMGAIIADEFKKINYRDLNTIIKATENEKNIIGCIPSGHDLSYLAYALYLDHRENKLNNRVELFEKIHNKLYFRRNLKKIAPNRCPDFIDVNDKEMVENIKNYPVLYKPNHAGGGRGIKFYNNQADLNKDLKKEKKECGVYEQYIQGVDYSISLWFQDSKLITFFADREFSSKNTFKINSSITNQDIIDYIKVKKIPEELVYIISELGIKNGFAHCQIRINHEESWFIIEITLRMPGDCYPEVPEMFCGLHYTEMYVSTFLPSVVGDLERNKSYIKEMNKDDLFGRACLREGQYLINELVACYDFYSHTKNNKDIYKITLFKSKKNKEIMSDLKIKNIINEF
jgi:hypothetical protein